LDASHQASFYVLACARSTDLVYCPLIVLQAPAAPAFGGFSWGKPAAEPAKAPEPAAAPATTESGSSDMGSMFSSDMWNTPIKVWHTQQQQQVCGFDSWAWCLVLRL
jgi:hypothetical protein